MGWIDLAEDRDEWGDSCEHDDEPSGPINFCEVLE
jgi:hypothetical protein